MQRINDKNELQKRLQEPASRIVYLECDINSLQQGMFAVELAYQGLRERSTATGNTFQFIRQGTLSV